MPFLTLRCWAVLKIFIGSSDEFFFLQNNAYNMKESVFCEFVFDVTVKPFNSKYKFQDGRCSCSPFFFSEKFQQEKWNVTVPIKTVHDTYHCAISLVRYVLNMLILDWCQIYNQYYKCSNIALPDSSSSGVDASLLFPGNPKSFTYWASVQCS